MRCLGREQWYVWAFVDEKCKRNLNPMISLGSTWSFCVCNCAHDAMTGLTVQNAVVQSSPVICSKYVGSKLVCWSVPILICLKPCKRLCWNSYDWVYVKTISGLVPQQTSAIFERHHIFPYFPSPFVRIRPTSRPIRASSGAASIATDPIDLPGDFGWGIT